MMLIVLKRFVLFLGLWVVISLNDPSAYAVGVLAAAAAAAVSLRLLPPKGRRVRLVAALRLAPGFAWRSLLGGLDVAWRAFHPRMPLSPPVDRLSGSPACRRRPGFAWRRAQPHAGHAGRRRAG
ncbi:MAG: Na+/H+ antiporter subunit E [Blastochloris sp.]|nr:Na+/H+ antiporter subunit E [Blastochloris sp.]